MNSDHIIYILKATSIINYVWNIISILNSITKLSKRKQLVLKISHSWINGSDSWIWKDNVARLYSSSVTRRVIRDSSALVMLNYYAPLDSKSPFKTLCFFFLYIYKKKVLGEIQGLTFLINRNPMEDFERELIS
jgi:hypothetical protein